MTLIQPGTLWRDTFFAFWNNRTRLLVCGCGFVALSVAALYIADVALDKALPPDIKTYVAHKIEAESSHIIIIPDRQKATEAALYSMIWKIISDIPIIISGYFFSVFYFQNNPGGKKTSLSIVGFVFWLKTALPFFSLFFLFQLSLLYLAAAVTETQLLFLGLLSCVAVWAYLSLRFLLALPAALIGVSAPFKMALSLSKGNLWFLIASAFVVTLFFILPFDFIFALLSNFLVRMASDEAIKFVRILCQSLSSVYDGMIYTIFACAAFNNLRQEKIR